MPDKKLTKPLKKNAGRSRGKITVRFRGGGAKRLYRIIDFGQNKPNAAGQVESIEYDPNRSARIALVRYEDGTKQYILAQDGMKPQDQVMAGERAPRKAGNRLLLGNIPLGSFVFNIELTPGRGGQIARAAGAQAKVLAHEGGRTHLQMPSGEVRRVPSSGFATLGAASNPGHRDRVLGKAGRKRHLGRRPHVRGSAMNPVDHPHGGGEGRSPIGLRRPKTPWGKTAFGVKTRKVKKYSDKWIISPRKKKKKKR